MLRASSQGLGLPLSVIRVHRRVRLLEHVRAIWSTEVSLTLGHGSQRTKDEKRRQNVQITQGIVEAENIEPNSALSNLLLYDAVSSNTTQNSTLRPARKVVDSFLEELAASFPSSKSQQPVVNTIGWNRNTMARKLVAVDAQTKGRGDICRKMLCMLGTTASPSEAWEAYTTLRRMIPDGYVMTGEQFIPFVHLHRLCRLLSASRPKNHMLFLRLLSILNYIRSTGGRIHRHEWNTVIDYAGRGWRKTLPEDWETALSLYNDMVNGRTPGAKCHVQVQLTETDDLHSVQPPGAELHGQVRLPKSDNLHAVQPDIYTFNILLDIAAETKQVSAVRHALALMTEAGIDPNRMTFLILLKYHGLSQQMSGVRSTVLRMKDEGHELGLDGINACMWAYGLNGRHDLVRSIYRLLRHNISPGETDDLLALSRDIEDEALFCVPGDIRPDGTTFTTVIQIMAYHGDLFTTLNVLSDALACLPARPGPRLLVLNGVFRAVFLGFTKHGISPIQDERSLPPPLRISNPPGQPQWSLQNLQKVFDIFMDLPEDINASRTMLHWIMRAFDVTSGRDKVILQEVWKKLDKRFGMRWVASTNRLASWRAMLFSETRGDVEPDTSHGGLEDDFDIGDDTLM